tara:strand:- start:2466 stop:3200 length:735 start_codon:yes stop_codon:yes gene_type:complete
MLVSFWFFFLSQKGFAQESCRKVLRMYETEACRENLTEKEAFFLVVNKEADHLLCSTYRPSNLVQLPGAWTRPGYRPAMIKEEVSEAFGKMREALKEDLGSKKYDLRVQSGFRSYRAQVITFCKSFNKKGKKRAFKYTALPGRSQHQLGTTMDIVAKSIQYQLRQKMETSSEYRWLKKRAREFGFVLSYPRPHDHPKQTMNHKTGYGFEPWHWRYIGLDAAMEYHEFLNKNPEVTLDEYLESLN